MMNGEFERTSTQPSTHLSFPLLLILQIGRWYVYDEVSSHIGCVLKKPTLV